MDNWYEHPAYYLIAFCTAGSVLLFLYIDRIRKYPLEFFGIANVQRLGRILGDDWREKIWADGSMSKHEWRRSNRLAQSILVSDVGLRNRVKRENSLGMTSEVSDVE